MNDKLKTGSGRKKAGKSKITAANVVDVLIRIFFFLTWPALFSTAFTGVKMLVGQIASISPLEWNSFVETLVILLTFTICFGRFFCGFACAFGSYGDLIYALSSFLQKKRKKKPFRVFDKYAGILRYGKYLVLAGILALVIAGNDAVVTQYGPFGTFSRLQSLKSPENLAGVLLFAAITAGMALEPRFFCRFLCPMGACFSLMPVLPVSVIKRDQDLCIPGCKACRMACPASLDLPYTDEGDNPLSGECFACGKCIHRCPKGSAAGLTGRPGWTAMQIVRAVLLAGIVMAAYR